MDVEQGLTIKARSEAYGLVSSLVILSLLGYMIFLNIFHLSRVLIIAANQPPECYLPNSRIAKKYSLLKICYFVRDIFDVFAPLKLLKYLKLWFAGRVVTISTSQYYVDYCSDSQYPDQVEYQELGIFNCIADTLPLLIVYSRRNATFELNQTDYAVYSRFIELLSSATLIYFSKTSKEVYKQCAETRGIELTLYSQTWIQGPYNDSTKVAKNGRLYYFKKNDAKMKLSISSRIRCLDTLLCHWSGTTHAFNLTYRQLILVSSKTPFDSEFKGAFRKYLHDGLKSVKLFIHASARPTGLTELVEYLQMLHNVEKIGVCFHVALYNSFKISLSAPATLREDPPIASVKAELENWSQSMPNLQFFKLIYNFKGYLLHDKQLKLMKRLYRKTWFLAEEYQAQDDETNQANFLQDLECPFYYEPPHYYSHVL